MVDRIGSSGSLVLWSICIPVAGIITVHMQHHMGEYCTHGRVLYTWASIVHMGEYCTLKTRVHTLFSLFSS